MTRKSETTGDEVLRRLESHAGALRGERYPGDLMTDLRPRLAATAPRRAVPVAALLTWTAASLLMAVWLARDPVRPERPALTAMPPRPRMPAMVPSMSASVPSMGRAFSLGAGAIARVRSPAAPVLSQPTIKED